MKKIFYAAVALSIAGTVFISSCKKDDKDDDNKTPSKTRTELLVGTWNSNFEAEDSNSNKMLDAYEKAIVTSGNSYVYKFNADGSGQVTSSFLNFPFAWSLQNSEQELRLIAFNDTFHNYFQTISETELVLEDRSGTPYTWVGFKK